MGDTPSPPLKGTLAKTNPGLIMVRLSGYGQTGPYRDRPGFGVIGESMGGMRYVTGYADRPPVQHDGKPGARIRRAGFRARARRKRAARNRAVEYYPTRDGKFVIVGANNDAIFKRMMTAIGRAACSSSTGCLTANPSSCRG